MLAAAVVASTMTLKVMTYNVHSCKGRDGRVLPARIAQVIKAQDPDIVALQEIRVGRVDPDKKEAEGVISPPVGESPLPPPSVIAPRKRGRTPPSGSDPRPFTDQPGIIADAVDMYHVFYPLVRLDTADYGIAVLSKYPLHIVRAANLPTLETRDPLERRGAIWVEIDVDGRKVQLINTHLGLNTREKAAQIRDILGEDWLASKKVSGPFIFAGDLNSRPNDIVYEQLSKFAKDALSNGSARATWHTFFPVFRIDHIFIPRSAEVLHSEVIRTPTTKVASDHFPVIAEITFP